MPRLLHRLRQKDTLAALPNGRYADGLGLYLQVRGDARSWIFRYRSRGTGKARELGMGSARALTLAEARERAKVHRRTLADGLDPINLAHAKRRAVEGQQTFQLAMLATIESKRPNWKTDPHTGKCASADQWEASLRNDASRLLPMDPQLVTTGDVIAIVEPIWTTKHESATRLLERIRTVLDMAAVRRGDGAYSNPARWKGHLEHVLGHKGQKRTPHKAQAFDKMPALWLALATSTGMAARAAELILATGCRASEVLGARWAEIDLKTAVWTIPGERIKTGRPLTIPLTPLLRDLLGALPRAGEFVFPKQTQGERSNARPTMSSDSVRQLLLRLTEGEHVTHGCRAVAKTWAAEKSDHAREVIEAMLGHAVGDAVERTYMRGEWLDKRRALLADWQSFLGGRQAKAAEKRMARA